MFRDELAERSPKNQMLSGSIPPRNNFFVFFACPFSGSIPPRHNLLSFLVAHQAKLADFNFAYRFRNHVSSLIIHRCFGRVFLRHFSSLKHMFSHVFISLCPKTGILHFSGTKCTVNYTPPLFRNVIFRPFCEFGHFVHAFL